MSSYEYSSVVRSLTKESLGSMNHRLSRLRPCLNRRKNGDVIFESQCVHGIYFVSQLHPHIGNPKSHVQQAVVTTGQHNANHSI